MPSILERLKAKRVSDSEKSKLLKDVKAEAFKHEQKRVALEDKKKQAEAFLREVEKAEKAGIEKARVGGKTYSVKSLVKRGKQAKQLAAKSIKAVDKGLEKTAKVLDAISFDEPVTKKKPFTKKKSATKKKTTTEKKPTTKKKTSTKKRAKK